MLRGYDLLAAISQPLFIPDGGFEKSLKCSGGDVLVQRDRLRVLPLPCGQIIEPNSKFCL